MGKGLFICQVLNWSSMISIKLGLPFKKLRVLENLYGWNVTFFRGFNISNIIPLRNSWSDMNNWYLFQTFRATGTDKRHEQRTKKWTWWWNTYDTFLTIFTTVASFTITRIACALSFTTTFRLKVGTNVTNLDEDRNRLVFATWQLQPDRMKMYVHLKRKWARKTFR